MTMEMIVMKIRKCNMKDEIFLIIFTSLQTIYYDIDKNREKNPITILNEQFLTVHPRNMSHFLGRI